MSSYFPEQGERPDDEFIDIIKNFNPPPPPQIDRESRKFDSYESAEAALGVILPHEIRELFKQPRFEQRTPEWFLAREHAITASDYAGAIGANPWSSPYSIVKKKLGKGTAFFGNTATNYGVINEDRAVYRYEKETGAKVIDFGLLSHHSLFGNDAPFSSSTTNQQKLDYFSKVHSTPNAFTWLKGSPDGVSILPDGRAVLLEVKCPISSFYPQTISCYYYPQIQLNMWLMNLKETHFVQYNPPSDIREERYDLLIVPFNEEWMNESIFCAKVVWDAILQQRPVVENGGEPLSRDELDTVQMQTPFPLCVSSAAKKSVLPRTTQKQLDNLKFVD